MTPPPRRSAQSRAMVRRRRPADARLRTSSTWTTTTNASDGAVYSPNASRVVGRTLAAATGDGQRGRVACAHGGESDALNTRDNPRMTDEFNARGAHSRVGQPEQLGPCDTLRAKRHPFGGLDTSVHGGLRRAKWGGR